MALRSAFFNGVRSYSWFYAAAFGLGTGHTEVGLPCDASLLFP